MSEIALAQAESDTPSLPAYRLRTNKVGVLRQLGYDATPSQVLIYPVDFNAKTAIREALDAYNEPLPDDDKIIYTDLALS